MYWINKLCTNRKSLFVQGDLPSFDPVGFEMNTVLMQWDLYHPEQHRSIIWSSLWYVLGLSHSHDWLNGINWYNLLKRLRLSCHLIPSCLLPTILVRPWHIQIETTPSYHSKHYHACLNLMQMYLEKERQTVHFQTVDCKIRQARPVQHENFSLLNMNMASFLKINMSCFHFSF